MVMKTMERVKDTPEKLRFGIWIWYTYENRVAWSEGFNRLLHLDNDAKPSFELLVECIYPDDVRTFYDNLIVVLNNWQPRWFTFRITLPDQSVRTLQCLLEGMPIGCNDVTDITGVCFDVTGGVVPIHQVDTTTDNRD
jgi:hypothetical protein